MLNVYCSKPEDDALESTALPDIKKSEVSASSFLGIVWSPVSMHTISCLHSDSYDTR
jgi:hypothetical protein